MVFFIVEGTFKTLGDRTNFFFDESQISEITFPNGIGSSVFITARGSESSSSINHANG
ncbi:MAG: hypothetical protein V3W41_04585 [Planctomycetota bacterium]